MKETIRALAEKGSIIQFFNIEFRPILSAHMVLFPSSNIATQNSDEKYLKLYMIHMYLFLQHNTNTGT